MNSHVSKRGPHVLVNLGNLRNGGGLQVGASFLDEIAGLVGTLEAHDRWPWLEHMVVEASHEVIANSTVDLTQVDVRAVDGSPWGAVRRGASGRRPYDVTFTVFGPDYSRRRSVRRIVGFADVTSAFPEDAEQPPGVATRARAAVRRRISRSAFLKADRLIVESPHMVDELRRRWKVTAPTSVVPNVVNSVFLHQDAQETLALPALVSPTLFFPTRAYRHKNLAFLGLVGQEMLVRHGCQVTFVLTLTDSEWGSLPQNVREFSVNLGPLRISQMPVAFRAADATIFPSLLESQSATPFEALVTGCPLLASDRPFVRSVVGDAAWYFDPHDPASAAAAVHALLDDGPERDRRRRRGLELMASWPTARDRACAYLDVIRDELTLIEDADS